jgi:hypothetical protein
MAQVTPIDNAVAALIAMRGEVAEAQDRAARAKDEWTAANEVLASLLSTIRQLEAFLTTRGVPLPIDKEVDATNPESATSDRLLALMAEEPHREWALQVLVQTFKQRRWDLNLANTEATIKAATKRLADSGDIARLRPGVFKLPSSSKEAKTTM